jgi:cell fate regulator YaaT (PSP1 superfamily)
VGVQFKDLGKVYYFAPNNIEFSVGDGVIVETARGVEYGKITIANTDMDSSKIVGSLKPVIRKATETDSKINANNLAKKPQAMKDAQEKIRKHNLDMKLVDVEFAFDGSKVVFFFTSDNRVDFRELVKDLASVFHNRIELRQIGIRDECKLKGGLGPCGRACCCNSCLEDFERVSIKMAKNQGLSLNPTKISGLCGRLMCCLKFEDEYYAETIKLMPRTGSEVATPDGRGVVENSNLLKRRVKVKVQLKSGDIEAREYGIKEIAIGKNATLAEVKPEEDEVVEEEAE